MPHKFDNSAASATAIKKEVQAKGLGVPQSTGQAHGGELFRQAPAINDAPDGPPETMEVTKNHPSAGTDSKVGAAGALGSLEVVRDAPTRNVAPENIDRT